MSDLTFEAMNRRVKAAGYRIQNLFHRYDGLYQCNLRSYDKVTAFEFGYGVTAALAMERALDKALSGKSVRQAPTEPDDADPLKVGQTKDPAAPVPAGELVGGRDAPAAPEPTAPTAPEPAAADEEDDLIG